MFSASLPPYLASAAITAIDVIDQNPDMLVKLKQNIALLWKGLIFHSDFNSATISFFFCFHFLMKNVGKHTRRIVGDQGDVASKQPGITYRFLEAR